MIGQPGDVSVFESMESEVRRYCRRWPAVFQRAQGSYLYDVDGRRYLDFFAGSGALNYGHNNPILKRALLDYLAADNIVLSLDLFTAAKRDFLATLDDVLLRPRGLGYRAMFPGPTGTSAVEAALQLARKVTGRRTVMSFTNSFHGMSLGSLSVTGRDVHRSAAGVPLVYTGLLPFDGYLDDSVSAVTWLEHLLADPGSGLDTPAAVIVETVQAEGGINVARPEWLRALASVCRHHGVLLIVDDIQMGCGRTGQFFSFEESGIHPDIVLLSKSLGGYGLPLSIVLFRPDLDVWRPGEHNGTFRGTNPSFVTATAALAGYWSNDGLSKSTAAHGLAVKTALHAIAEKHADLVVQYRGRGLVWGLEMVHPEHAGAICSAAYRHGLLIETAGPRDEVVKLAPPLTIGGAELDEGLDIVTQVAGQLT